MALRPIFIPERNGKLLVKETNLTFKWYPGSSASQKQKSIRSLHESASQTGIEPVLEVSTKSVDPIGRQLSAFNLRLKLGELSTSVEAAYQGSKIFEHGGPYIDLYRKSGFEIKKDFRLNNSGRLIGFQLEEEMWPTKPITAFYDWLYLNALHQAPSLATKLLQYKGFTDISFNPKKSINCQARSAALYVALERRGLFRGIVYSKDIFVKLVTSGISMPVENTLLTQGDLFDGY
jgi:hypothetical protein